VHASFENTSQRYRRILINGYAFPRGKRPRLSRRRRRPQIDRSRGPTGRPVHVLTVDMSIKGFEASLPSAVSAG
jgi:hypothetical protein